MRGLITLVSLMNGSNHKHMQINEIYNKIIELVKYIPQDDDGQYVIDGQIETLIEMVNTKIASINDDEKELILLPIFHNIHSKNFRSLFLKTLENVSTATINNFLLNEAMLENDVSGVIPYLQLFRESNDKKIIMDKVNDIYISDQVKSNTKEFNNLCTLLFYTGARHDVINKMRTDLEELNETSYNLVSGILDKSSVKNPLKTAK